MRIGATKAPHTLRRIAVTWWPLAASWLLMGAELPALSAVVARLPQPEISLAAYGGVVFPLALIIEAPIIMLLSASTALCQDIASYRKVRSFMMAAGASLTALHAAVAFTPLYDVVVTGVLGVPAEIVEPARIGFMIMLPWTWSIAYRRFNQGVLIRFGHSRAVGAGTMIRLSADLVVLTVGYALATVPGMVVAACAVAAGVLCEAVYSGIRVRPVVRQELAAAATVSPALSYRTFFAFYMPLVLTSLMSLLSQPIGSAALSRMPQALPSLAAWPVVSGLVWMIRALGISFNEVVVAHLESPASVPHLRRFTAILASGTTALLLAVATTPLASLWFEKVSALSPGLAQLAHTALWIALPLPALSTLQSWYQGAILHSRRTRGITEAVTLYLLVSAAVLLGGVAWKGTAGLHIGMAALVVSTLAQTAWLWVRSRPALVKGTGQHHVAGVVG